MNKKRILIKLFVLSIISIFFVNNTKAEEIKGNYFYYIENYNVEIKVNENNSFDIKEKIETNFTYPQKHGIIRKIPIVNSIERTDGTKSSNRSILSNVNVNNEFTRYKEDNYYAIKIGNPDIIVTGIKLYEISYNYNIGKDPLKDIDEFYFNIIGNEWDTKINKVNFKITMPKDFDSSKIGFSYGIKGATRNEKVNYEVIGNEIIGSLDEVLNFYEGLTIRIELPNNYFENNGLSNIFYNYLPYLLIVLFALISIVIWLIFGRDGIVVEPVEINVPDDLNSLEIGQLYKGKANEKDVISLLLYLANKGYIQIIEPDLSNISTSTFFVIKKTKYYDRSNFYEDLFLKGLFENSKKADKIVLNNVTVDLNDTSDIVTSIELNNVFYQTINYILSIINSRENLKTSIKTSTGKTMFIKLLISISILIINIKPYFEIYQINIMNFFYYFISFDSGTMPIVYLLVFAFFLFFATYNSIINFENKNRQIQSKGYKVALIIMFFIFWIGYLFLMYTFVFKTNTLYINGFIIGTICIYIMFFMIHIMPKRTFYGKQIYGRIKGFKRFLETVEKENLIKYVEENPSYFYDILPYTYVLGISDLWIKKFEDIAINPPSWHVGSLNYKNSSNNFMKSAERSLTSKPRGSSSSGYSSSSSGGGSSGGGSSGGGSGGGGGSSW